MILRRIEPVSFGKISGVLYALLGIFIGLFFSLVSLVAGTIGGVGPEEPFPLYGLLFGAGSVIVFPILYGIMGFIFGMLTAWLYNVAAGYVGGIEVAFE
jgi:hypothetical protein